MKWVKVRSYPMLLQNKLREQIIETAELQNLPTLGFPLYRNIPTHLPTAMAELLRIDLIALALHATTVEMVTQEDENVIRLIYETLLTIDPKKEFIIID